jgi:predicted Zn-dependent protease
VLLQADPTDSVLWQQVAFLYGRVADRMDRLAALEASLLCEPDSLRRHHQFLSGLLGAGDWVTVVKRGQALLEGPLAEEAKADVALIELLVSAADTGARDALMARWLALVDVDKWTASMQFAHVRRALRQGEAETARAGLRRVMEAGSTDAAVFLWAGHLAESAGDHAEAETLYESAQTLGGPSAQMAGLYLARLQLSQGRHEHARRQLRAYLNEHPEDASARALLQLAEGALAETAGDTDSTTPAGVGN